LDPNQSQESVGILAIHLFDEYRYTQIEPKKMAEIENGGASVPSDTDKVSAEYVKVAVEIDNEELTKAVSTGNPLMDFWNSVLRAEPTAKVS